MLQHCKSWFVQRWDSRWQRWEWRERTSEQDQQSCWLSEEGGPSSSDNDDIVFDLIWNSLQGWLDKYWHFVFMSPPPFHSFPAQKWKISHFCLNFQMWWIFLNKNNHKKVGKIEDLFWTKKVEYRADSVTLPLLQLAKQVKIWDFWYFAFLRKLAKTKWEIIELSGESTHVQPWTSWVVLSGYRWDFHTFICN